MRKLLCLLVLLVASVCANAQKNPEYGYPETYLQYTPAIFNLSAGSLGLPCRHGFRERLVTSSIAYATCFAVTQGLKLVVHEERPDGSRCNSFPSAHTAAAFTGAELIRQEYGNNVGSVFYAGGVYVAAMRVQHRRHWWWDTVAGAGFGVLSAWVGTWLSDPVWNVLEDMGVQRDGNVAVAPAIDPGTGAFCATLAVKF